MTSPSAQRPSPGSRWYHETQTRLSPSQEPPSFAGCSSLEILEPEWNRSQLRKRLSLLFPTITRCIFKRFRENLAGSCKHAGFCPKFRQLCSFFLVHRRFCSQGVHIPGVDGVVMKHRNLAVKLISAIFYLLKSSPLRIVSPANEFTCCLFSLVDCEDLMMVTVVVMIAMLIVLVIR